jgi:HD-like signal output (HDOD) protein
VSKDNANPVTQALSRFDHLSGLGDEQLTELAGQIRVLEADGGARLLDLGSKETRLLFLVEGALELLAEDGARHIVRHTDAAALGPVSRLRPSRYRVTAVGAVRYLMIDHQIIDQLSRNDEIDAMQIDEVHLAVDPDSADEAASHPLMFDVLDDINRGFVLLPSEPDMAVQVGDSLRSAGDNVIKMAEILTVCPVIALKATRAAMALESGRADIRSMREVIARLGVEPTFELSIHCVLRETLRTESANARAAMKDWWERTVRITAACAALARISERFDPEFAALVGLMHGFGEAVLLQYVDRHGNLDADTALARAVHYNRTQVGHILAVMWGLPREIGEAANECNNWSYRHAGEANYVDILLVGQWFVMAFEGKQSTLPALENFRAAKQLGIGKASEEFRDGVEEAVAQAVMHAAALLARS